MKLTAEYVKEYAKSIGADIVGIGDIADYEGSQPEADPRFILPKARCVIGAAFRIPRGIIETMNTQPYAYTALGVKSIDEERVTVFLLKMARLIENAGYEACIQRTCPNLLQKGFDGTNYEVKTSVGLRSISVDGQKPAPDVLIDFQKSAEICHLAKVGRYGKALTPEFGPYQRFAFIVTNAPLEPDAPLEFSPCENCDACTHACPGKAIASDGTLDTWQCSVYYRGAAEPSVLPENIANRAEILAGEVRFDRESAEKIYPSLDLYPPTHYGYVPCLCGKACDQACYNHIKGLKGESR